MTSQIRLFRNTLKEGLPCVVRKILWCGDGWSSQRGSAKVGVKKKRATLDRDPHKQRSSIDPEVIETDGVETGIALHYHGAAP